MNLFLIWNSRHLWPTQLLPFVRWFQLLKEELKHVIVNVQWVDQYRYFIIMINKVVQLEWSENVGIIILMMMIVSVQLTKFAFFSCFIKLRLFVVFFFWYWKDIKKNLFCLKGHCIVLDSWKNDERNFRSFPRFEYDVKRRTIGVLEEFLFCWQRFEWADDRRVYYVAIIKTEDTLDYLQQNCYSFCLN